MNINLIRLSLILSVLALASCNPPEVKPEPKKMSPTEFLDYVNEQYKKDGQEFASAAWVRSTYIIPDTAILATKATSRYMELTKTIRMQANEYDMSQMSGKTKIAFSRIMNGPNIWTDSLPSQTQEEQEALAAIATSLEGQYGSGKYCKKADNGEQTCMNLQDLSKTISSSRGYDELQEAWVGWRTVSAGYRDEYKNFIDLNNKSAQSWGYKNLGDFWKSGYEMSASEFEAEIERLWQEVKPFYEELHCYARLKLAEVYGKDKIADGEPIPAHLLGNMWAQSWGNIYELLEPVPGVQSQDVTPSLQGKDAVTITKLAENFFVSLGMPKLPKTFWERSILTKPRDRDIVCHASAWHMDGKDDVRIKQCVEAKSEDFRVLHHELGHIYYFLAYKDQPQLFQNGAHDGFHEAIGDTIALSLTPGYMKDIGLLQELKSSSEAELNYLMAMALDKIAFLPFAKIVDQWRWGVFSGEIKPEDYNKAWWDLRLKYQGIVPPVSRSEADFDPGAKYHVAANVPYTRYFTARIMQFQFHQALCQAAGHKGPLHQCSIYNNKEAGKVLIDMLSKGSSQPWTDTLEEAIGTKKMDATAIIDYFAPLQQWLKKQNEGQTCGW